MCSISSSSLCASSSRRAASARPPGLPWPSCHSAIQARKPPRGDDHRLPVVVIGWRGWLRCTGLLRGRRALAHNGRPLQRRRLPLPGWALVTIVRGDDRHLCCLHVPHRQPFGSCRSVHQCVPWHAPAPGARRSAPILRRSVRHFMWFLGVADLAHCTGATGEKSFRPQNPFCGPLQCSIDV